MYLNKSANNIPAPNLLCIQSLCPWIQSLANVLNCHIIDRYVIANEPTELETRSVIRNFASRNY